MAEHGFSVATLPNPFTTTGVEKAAAEPAKTGGRKKAVPFVLSGGRQKKTARLAISGKQLIPIAAPHFSHAARITIHQLIATGKIRKERKPHQKRDKCMLELLEKFQREGLVKLERGERKDTGRRGNWNVTRIQWLKGSASQSGRNNVLAFNKVFEEVESNKICEHGCQFFRSRSITPIDGARGAYLDWFTSSVWAVNSRQQEKQEKVRRDQLSKNRKVV